MQGCKVKELRPDLGDLSLTLVVVCVESVAETPSADGTILFAADVLVGDETGVVLLTTTRALDLDILTPGAHILLSAARTTLTHTGHLRLVSDSPWTQSPPPILLLSSSGPSSSPSSSPSSHPSSSPSSDSPSQSPSHSPSHSPTPATPPPTPLLSNNLSDIAYDLVIL